MLLNFYFYPDVQKTPGEIGGGYVWDFMESFKKYIEHELNRQTRSRFITKIRKRSYDKEIKDYKFLKIATINNIYDSDEDYIYFIGIFQQWLCIDSN